MAGTRDRLSRSDWIETALAALADGGLPAVAVEPLAKRLSTTKGSFYWHFADRHELIVATLAGWRARYVEEPIALLSAEPDPRERLRSVLRNAFGDRSVAALDIHLAASVDVDVNEALRDATNARLAFLATAYRQCGCTAAEARQRSVAAFAAILGVGVMRRGGLPPTGSGRDLSEFIALFVPP